MTTLYLYDDTKDGPTSPPMRSPAHFATIKNVDEGYYSELAFLYYLSSIFMEHPSLVRIEAEDGRGWGARWETFPVPWVTPNGDNGIRLRSVATAYRLPENATTRTP